MEPSADSGISNSLASAGSPSAPPPCSWRRMTIRTGTLMFRWRPSIRATWSARDAAQAVNNSPSIAFKAATASPSTMRASAIRSAMAEPSARRCSTSSPESARCSARRHSASPSRKARAAASRPPGVSSSSCANSAVARQLATTAGVMGPPRLTTAKASNAPTKRGRLRRAGDRAADAAAATDLAQFGSSIADASCVTSGVDNGSASRKIAPRDRSRLTPTPHRSNDTAVSGGS